MTKNILVHVDCGSVNASGRGNSGDYVVGASLLHLLSNSPQLAGSSFRIILLSSPGGVIKLQNLYGHEEAGTDRKLHLGGKLVSLMSVDEAKSKLDFRATVLFAQLGTCRHCNDSDMCALINSKTKILVSLGVSSDCHTDPFCLGERFPSLVEGGEGGRESVKYKRGLDITFVKMGFGAKQLGFSLIPPQPISASAVSCPMPESLFGFGYYSAIGGPEKTTRLISNYLSLSTSAPYLNNRVILIGNASSCVKEGIENFMLAMLQVETEYNRFTIGSSARLTISIDGTEETKLFQIESESNVIEVEPTPENCSDLKLEVSHYDKLPNSHVRHLMAEAHGPVLTTGLMSMLECMASGSTPFYQFLENNIGFIRSYLKGLEDLLSSNPESARLTSITKLLINNTTSAAFLRDWRELAPRAAELDALAKVNQELMRSSQAHSRDTLSHLIRGVKLKFVIRTPSNVHMTRAKYLAKLGIYAEAPGTAVEPRTAALPCYSRHIPFDDMMTLMLLSALAQRRSAASIDFLPSRHQLAIQIPPTDSRERVEEEVSPAMTP